MNGNTSARAWVRGLAEERGWPAVKLRREEGPAGEAAWRRWLAGCSIFALGEAERASQGGDRREGESTPMSAPATSAARKPRAERRPPGSVTLRPAPVAPERGAIT